MKLRRVAAVLAVLTSCAVGAAAPADAVEPLSVAVWGGIFDLEESELTEVGVELRGPDSLPLGLGWIGGLAGNEEGGYWAHVGMRRPFRWGSSWLATPSFSATYYERGDGKELGQELEFRSAIEVAYRWDNGATLGGLFYHLSNASLSDTNPGENSLVLVVGIPIGR